MGDLIEQVAPPDPTATTVVSLDDVSKLFGALRAVDHVTLELFAGSICGLVGPNGSGKTTLLNLVNAFASASEGTVKLLGKDVTKSHAYAVARLGVGRTFQLVRLVGDETVRENVSGGLFWDHQRSRQGTVIGSKRAARAVKDRVDAVLERLDIASYADKHALTLPFGIQRRVELARAIISEPALLLLDEPAAGVSEKDLEELGKAMHAEKERGCCVLLVDHHLRFVLDVCPRLVVLNYGQKIFDGSAQEAANDPLVREAYMGT
jgi:branched-chain amino acid transport system ATP-binding protein